ncbi:MAG: hypothetical protein ACIARR_07085 [Phycisphaerales bacterium JB059]
MNTAERHDDALDRGLRAIGEHLPEPAPRPDLCARLTRLIDGAQTDDAPEHPTPGPFTRRLHRFVGALAAMIVVGGLAWGVISSRPQAPSPSEDGRAEGELTLISFYHDRCPVAREMEPRFKELAGRCRSRKLTVRRVDMTDWAPGHEDEQLRSLGLGCVLRSCQMPVLTGAVMVVDEEGEILAQARGDEPLDQVERALTDQPPSP